MQDLDELHASYVEPLVQRVQQVTSHRKFIDGTKAQVDEQVRRTALMPSSPDAMSARAAATLAPALAVIGGRALAVEGGDGVRRSACMALAWRLQVRAEFMATQGQPIPYHLGVALEKSNVVFFIAFATRSSSQPDGLRVSAVEWKGGGREGEGGPNVVFFIAFATRSSSQPDGLRVSVFGWRGASDRAAARHVRLVPPDRTRVSALLPERVRERRLRICGPGVQAAGAEGWSDSRTARLPLAPCCALPCPPLQLRHDYFQPRHDGFYFRKRIFEE